MKNMNQQGDKQNEQACDIALGWLVRLRSDSVSEEDRQAFALWLGEHHSHLQAMDEALELWDDLAVVRRLPTPNMAANSSRWLPAAMAAAACLVLAIFLWPQLQSDPVSSQYRSAMGERRNIELPDGSLALLNTNSSISVTYSDDQRHINLQQGEAWFKVQADKQRPFHVDAGEARITALGTAFNVYRHANSTDITVTEGVVRVTELGETGGRAATDEVLRENQQLLASSNGWDISTSENIDQQLAWQRGQLVAREMPLPELIAQLQRYSDTDILIGDPELFTMTVSGVFELDKPDATLQALAVSLDLTATPLEDNSVRLLKASQ